MLDLAELAEALTTSDGGTYTDRLGAYIEINPDRANTTPDTAHLDLTVNTDNGTAETLAVVITRKARP